MRGLGIDLKDSITDRMATRSPFGVWVPVDFADLGPREAVDQVLHRLVRAGMIRRITRGLYDKPNLNGLTGKSTHPDPRSVIDALVRRNSARMIVDGITAANDIGLSDAVPTHIIVHTDARLRHNRRPARRAVHPANLDAILSARSDNRPERAT